MNNEELRHVAVDETSSRTRMVDPVNSSANECVTALLDETRRQVTLGVSTLDDEDSLSLEQIDNLWLCEFEKRFYATLKLHKGIIFDDVKKSLREDLTTMRNLQKWDKLGHMMNVFSFDKKTHEFVFASSWIDYEQVSPSHRNIVFNQEIQDWFEENFPNIKINGNAEAISKSMGGQLADGQLHHQKLLTSLDIEQKNNFRGWAYLKTTSAMSEFRKVNGIFRPGDARIGNADGTCMFDAAIPRSDLSFRVELRVKKND